MAYKKGCFTDFTAKVADGTEYVFTCFSQGTRYGFRHVCTKDGLQMSKACYYNRTWERFRFESVLVGAIEKCPKRHQAELRAIIIDGHCYGW